MTYWHLTTWLHAPCLCQTNDCLLITDTTLGAHQAKASSFRSFPWLRWPKLKLSSKGPLDLQVEWHKVLTSKIGFLPTVQCTALENSLPNSQFTFAILYVCLGHSILGLIEFHLASILLDQYLLTSMNYINDAWRSQILVLAVQHPQLKGSSSSSCSFWNPFFSLLQTICSTENKA